MLTCLQIVLMDELIVCKPCGITFFPKNFFLLWAQRGLAPLRPYALSSIAFLLIVLYKCSNQPVLTLKNQVPQTNSLP